ncbi:unnamed protein product [Vicia faba]|uniref:Uncharacterized protein n=1 Tax=Vicia faba TaxID=3906 RepID=A0AAV1A682_VICFA|nr:unnamed protein product [Vicia faba]
MAAKEKEHSPIIEEDKVLSQVLLHKQLVGVTLVSYTQVFSKIWPNLMYTYRLGHLLSNRYISQWDQFTAQVEPIASTIPYMIDIGYHKHDWPNIGSFYNTTDSGGECGVLAETMFFGAHAFVGIHTPGAFKNQLQTPFSEPRLFILTDCYLGRDIVLFVKLYLCFVCLQPIEEASR